MAHGRRHAAGDRLVREPRRTAPSRLLSDRELGDFGYTTEQRRIIATIARYVGNSRPTPNDRPIRALGGNDRELVPKAVMLLRLARALNQSRNGIVRSVRARVQGGRVSLTIDAKRPGPDLEIWALEKEAAYFQSVFGRELAATGS